MQCKIISYHAQNLILPQDACTGVPKDYPAANFLQQTPSVWKSLWIGEELLRVSCIIFSLPRLQSLLMQRSRSCLSKLPASPALCIGVGKEGR